MVRKKGNDPYKNLEILQFAGKYSLKCIPIPTNKEYTKKLISQIEKILKRMRWKALFFSKNIKNIN